MQAIYIKKTQTTPTIHESNMKHQTSLTVCVKHRVINQRVPVFGPGWNKAENAQQLLSF